MSALYAVLSGKAVQVDPATLGLTIPTDFVGISFEVSYVTLNKLKNANTALKNYVNLFGGNLHIRIGGSTSDTQIPANASIDDMANFVSTVGAKLVYGVPGKLVAPSATDAAQAAVDAAIAARIAAILGTANVWYALGNEPNFYGEAYAVYAARWQIIHDAVVASVAAAKFIGSDDGSSTLTKPSFLVQFAPDKGSQVGFYAMHKYGIGGNNNPLTNVPLLLKNLGLFVDVRARGQDPLLSGHKLRLTETGGFTGASNQLDGPSLGTTLWALRSMVHLAKYGWAGINFHNPEQLTQGYAPLQDQNNGTWNGGLPWAAFSDVYDGNGTYKAQGTFYAMKLFSELVGGQIIPHTGIGKDGGALAVKGADAKTRVLIINDDLDSGVSIPITSTAAFTTATAKILTAPDYASIAVTLGGATVGPTGAFAPVDKVLTVGGGIATLVLPPASSAVVTLS